jgi:hypothetical protein
MTKLTENDLSIFYSNDLRLKSAVIQGDDCYFVDFYKDDVIIDSRRIEDKSLRYAEDLAENFVNGIIQVDPITMRIHGTI